ncbi:MAG TPA: TonB-dependent receptor, partial [Porphyromonadaceae bacterium]|nr:TonB-dependent receptor [Porphyromonadaceae bacterium]
VYASVTKGYKVGGYNVQMFADLIQESLKNKFNPGGTTTSIQDAVSYAPEKSWNYELGGRCDIIPNHLNADLTFFYMDIDDIQLTKFVNSGNGRIIANAGAASSYGAEVSLRSRITDALSADLNYGYTHATFKNYDDGKNNYEGNFIPYTPRHTFSVGINYARTLRCPFIDQVSFSTQYTAAGKIYWTERNDFYQKFYGTLNAKIGFRKGAVKLDVWAKNILNTDYQAFYFESFGNSFVQKGKPFRMGADVSVSF